MELIPSLDLRDGRCVRLYQGDFGRERLVSPDPLEVALRWEALGVPRLHIVDLDGALTGTPGNLEVIRRIATQAHTPLQVGGGIRDLETADLLLQMGARRVVLGTAAVEDPALVEQAVGRFGPEAVVVALDARRGRVAVRGWTQPTARLALTLAREMEARGVRRFLYTDISRDGTLTEPNLSAIRALVAATSCSVLASGGITSIDHLARLAELGVEGAVLGIALYQGTLDLREAMKVLA